MRWDSPFVLSTAGTVAVHIILIVSGDVLRQFKPDPPKPAPHIELINVDVPPPPPELPPPPPPPEAVVKPEPVKPEPVKPEPVKPEPKPQKIAAKEQPEPEPPEEPASDPIKPDLTPGPPAGGDAPVIKVDDLSGGTGTGTAHGSSGGGGHGRGGRGGGTGNGAGTGDKSGVGEAGPPTPVSVATIKKRAMPKGDQSYLDVGKDYPPEAKQLGIEGEIRVKLIVDATGKVASATLITKLGHGLDELALQRAKLIEFEPALSTDGTAVSSVVVWTFNMALPK